MGVLNDRILFGYTTPGHRFLHIEGKILWASGPNTAWDAAFTKIAVPSQLHLFDPTSFNISDRAMPRNESMDGLDTLLAEVRLAAAAQQQQLAIHLYYQQILGKTSTVLDSCKSLSSLHWRNDLLMLCQQHANTSWIFGLPHFAQNPPRNSSQVVGWRWEKNRSN